MPIPTAEEIGVRRQLEAQQDDLEREFRRRKDFKVRWLRSELRNLESHLKKIRMARARRGQLTAEIDEMERGFARNHEILARTLDEITALGENAPGDLPPMRRWCDICGATRDWRFEVDAIRYCGPCAEEHGVRPRGKIS